MMSSPNTNPCLRCQKCNVKISKKSFLLHMINEHKKNKPRFNCEDCEETFKNPKECIAHLKQRHDDGAAPLNCAYDDCHMKFDDMTKGTRHFNVHNKKRRLDESQAVDPNENRFLVSDPKKSLPYLRGPPSIRYDTVALAEILLSIRDNPIALAELLKSEKLGLQLDIEPFVVALESGRCKPLECIRNDADMPQLFDLKAVEPDLDPNDVSGAAITGLPQSTIYRGHNNKAPIQYEDRYVMDFIGRTCEGLPKYAINIPLPQFSLHPPSNVAAKYHAYESQTTNAYAVSANVSMRGAVVDIHEDRGTLGITAMDNHQMKLWILYPGLGNRHVFEKESAVSQRLARCEEALTGGLFAVTLPGEGIVLPPGWLHATLTINPGVLFGSTVMVAEGVSEAAQSYKHDVMTNEAISFHDLKPLLCSLQEAVSAELDDQWRKALSYLCDSNFDKFKGNQGKSDIEGLIDTLRRVVNDKKHQACTHCGVDLLEHFPFNMNMAARGAGKRKLDPPPRKKARPIESDALDPTTSRLRSRMKR